MLRIYLELSVLLLLLLLIISMLQMYLNMCYLLMLLLLNTSVFQRYLDLSRLLLLLFAVFVRVDAVRVDRAWRVGCVPAWGGRADHARVVFALGDETQLRGVLEFRQLAAGERSYELGHAFQRVQTLEELTLAG